MVTRALGASVFQRLDSRLAAQKPGSSENMKFKQAHVKCTRINCNVVKCEALCVRESQMWTKILLGLEIIWLTFVTFRIRLNYCNS
jgi:hypothetical protein